MGNRTPDLLHAKQALSKLSYTPTILRSIGAPHWKRVNARRGTVPLQILLAYCVADRSDPGQWWYFTKFRLLWVTPSWGDSLAEDYRDLMRNGQLVVQFAREITGLPSHAADLRHIGRPNAVSQDYPSSISVVCPIS